MYVDGYYYYITNLQGDVISIVNTSGTVAASYEYDPYGNVISATGDFAEVNPLRYRGYVYDIETGLYYVSSRYYDPEIGRFINADTYASTGQGILGNNMFAYCGNDPVNYNDPSGYLRLDVATCSAVDADWGIRASAALDPIYSKSEGTINGQAVFEFAQVAFGLGTYADNGCGAIAVYNTMQLLDHHISLGMVTDQFIHNDGLLLGGLLGVNPWSIDDVLAEHGISCTGYGSYWALAQNLSNNDIIIFAVLNNAGNLFAGAHFMSAQYSNGEFLVYNFSNKKTTVTSVSSLDPVYGNSVWIYGYIVGG